jgi:type IV pilus assembly protein PilA
MRSDLQFKLLSHLNKKQEDKGFTLIELLVVVIIIGVLAAVALPNLLKKVGKARETELKNAAGTVNRSQQSYHFERQLFAPGLTFLGISVPTEYVSNGDPGTAPNPADPPAGGNLAIDGGTSAFATVQPANDNATNDGTRAYSGRIDYGSGTYAQILCQSDDVSIFLTAPTDAATCPGGSVQIR